MFGFCISSQGNLTKWLILNSQTDLSQCSKLQMSKDNSHFEITWITQIHKWLPNYYQIKMTALPHLIRVIRLQKLLHLHVVFFPMTQFLLWGKDWRNMLQRRQQMEGWKASALGHFPTAGGRSWEEPNHFAQEGAQRVTRKGGRSEEGWREWENASEGQALLVID